MNSKCSVTVLFVCFQILFTLTDCDTCDKKILEGESLIFELADRPLKDDDRFIVKKVDRVIVPKRNKNQQGPGIVKDNNLELQNVDLSYTGTYTVEVFDGNGKKLKSYSEYVCLYAKVPKPKVTITCQNETVDFRCDVEVDKDMRPDISYSWHKNEKELKNNEFSFSTSIDEDMSNYTCTVQNQMHNNTSDPVEAACFKPVIFVGNSGFAFEPLTVVTLLAGGGVLIGLCW